MTRMNERALATLDRALRAAGQHDEITTLACGSKVLDLNREETGGMLAGRLMAEAVTAGGTEVALTQSELGGAPWPYVQVTSDEPWMSCYICQSANWPVSASGYRAMGSGPACLLGKKELFAPEGIVEEPTCALLGLEARQTPGEDACLELAAACGVKPEDFWALVAPTACLAGSVQIAARSVETGLHKLHHLGFDLHKVRSATGLCPIAPPTQDDWLSIGLTNDFMMFGAQVWLAVTGAEDDELDQAARLLPASASPAYGARFLEILKAAGDFYNVDPGIFAPAEVTLLNLSSGRCFHSGRRDDARLVNLMKGN